MTRDHVLDQGFAQERAITCTGFHLKPVGFFDGNPALDVPLSPPAACHH